MDAKISAVAHVRLIKKDNEGNIIEVKEQDIDLTSEEAKELWQSQQPE